MIGDRAAARERAKAEVRALEHRTRRGDDYRRASRTVALIEADIEAMKADGTYNKWSAPGMDAALAVAKFAQAFFVPIRGASCAFGPDKHSVYNGPPTYEADEERN